MLINNEERSRGFLGFCQTAVGLCLLTITTPRGVKTNRTQSHLYLPSLLCLSLELTVHPVLLYGTRPDGGLLFYRLSCDGDLLSISGMVVERVSIEGGLLLSIEGGHIYRPADGFDQLFFFPASLGFFVKLRFQPAPVELVKPNV